MQNAKNIEIGLVDWINRIAEDLRYVNRKAREIPGQHDTERENEIGDGQSHHNRRMNPARQVFRAAQRTPSAEHEKQLPSEWIERPGAARVGRDISFKK